MTIRKPTDYSALFSELDKLTAAHLPQPNGQVWNEGISAKAGLEAQFYVDSAAHGAGYASTGHPAGQGPGG